MRRLSIALAAATLGASSLTLGLSGAATAATSTFGSLCLATGAYPNTYVMTGAWVNSPLPIAAPSSGVITKARFARSAASSSVYSTTVKVLRATGTPNQYTVIAQSAPVPVTGGVTTYDVRVPIAVGDLLGLYGTPGAVVCSTDDVDDVVGVVSGDQAPGTTPTFTPATKMALPLEVTVEPDADHDGFGDETQDLCPRLATVHLGCPVTLDSFATPGGRSITVLVTADGTASVQVTGAARAKGKKFKLGSGTKAIAPGVLTKIKIKLPKRLRAALAALPPGRSIKVSLIATATDLLGRVTTDTTKVRVHGTHR